MTSFMNSAMVSLCCSCYCWS